MLFIKWLRFYKGSVRFSVRGKFVERFLNLAARGGIPIWNASRDEDCFTGFTLARKYKKLRPLVRKTHVMVRVEERFGLPFFIKRYHRRTGLIIGVALFCSAIFASGLFVWDIEVNGNKGVLASDIIRVAEEEGLRRGRLKSSINVMAIAEEICLRFNNIGWAAVNLVGTVADIEVEERVIPPQAKDDRFPCNIIAAKGGQLVYMDVYEGQKVATLKSTVKKGDIIVSGITQDKEGNSLLKHSRAKVIAEYSETKKFFFPLKQTEKVQTGGAVNYKYLKLGGKYFPLFLGRGKPESSFERVFVRPATCFGNRLPFDLTIRQVIPALEEEITVTEAKAKQMAMGLMERYERQVTAGSLGEREIMDKQIDGKITNLGYEITVKYVFRENIGQEEEIFIKKQHNT